MTSSTAGARHLADSRNWSAWQDDLERRQSIARAVFYDSSSKATLCQLAAAHDGAEPATWLQQFYERLAS